MPAAAVLEATGAGVARCEPLRGGDLSAVWRVWLETGGTVVVKSAPGAEQEARMLTHLRDRALDVPEVYGSRDDVLVMQDLGPSRSLSDRDTAGWHALATQLEHLHQPCHEAYGWPENHAFGPVSIVNGVEPT